MKSQKGQSLVEFALTIPVLLILLFGIIDFGRIFFVFLTMDNTGREVTRAISIGKDENTIKTEAVKAFNDKVKNLNNVTLLETNVIVTPTSRLSGTPVVTTITYSVKFITPIAKFITPILGNSESLPLKNTTTMRVE